MLQTVAVTAKAVFSTSVLIWVHAASNNHTNMFSKTFIQYVDTEHIKKKSPKMFLFLQNIQYYSKTTNFCGFKKFYIILTDSNSSWLRFQKDCGREKHYF